MEKAKRIEQPLLFGEKPKEKGAPNPHGTFPHPEVSRLVSLLRECERTFSFLAVDCTLSPSEREAVKKAAAALHRRLSVFFAGRK